MTPSLSKIIPALHLVFSTKVRAGLIFSGISTDCYAYRGLSEWRVVLSGLKDYLVYPVTRADGPGWYVARFLRQFIVAHRK